MPVPAPPVSPSPPVSPGPPVPDPADPATAFVTGTFHAHFADLPDPRVARGRRHRLLDIVTVAVCAVLCGADTWVDVAAFGRAKEAWLRAFLPLPGGIPSHDTFGRVFAALDPVAFEAAFVGWVQALVATAPATEPVEPGPGTPSAPGPLVAIDGKTARRSHDRSRDRGPLHLVSAWAEGSGLVLGQVAVGAKTNEIVAIPALLETLALAGTTVTIDAMGCQRGIAATIVDRGADYVLALKANQGELHELVAHHFAGIGTGVIADVLPGAPAEPGAHVTVGKDHGRVETRACWATGDPAVLRWLDPDGLWPGLRSVACVEGGTAPRDGQPRRAGRYGHRDPGPAVLPE